MIVRIYIMIILINRNINIYQVLILQNTGLILRTVFNLYLTRDKHPEVPNVRCVPESSNRPRILNHHQEHFVDSMWYTREF